MRTLLSCFLLLASFFCASAIADVEPSGHIQIRIIKVLPIGSVTIEISNSSKVPVRIWEDSNSWGAAHWRVLRIRRGEIETFYENPDRLFTKNVPAFTEIAGGSQVTRVLNVNGGNWCGFGHCSRYKQAGFDGARVSFDATDVLIAIYDVSPTAESTKLRVWNGVAAAMTTVP